MQRVINGYTVDIVVNDAFIAFAANKENSCSIEGTIKWDGCSNWDFQADGIQPHFCGLEDVTEFGNLIVELYKVAAEHLPCWDAELAKVAAEHLPCWDAELAS